MPTGLRLGERDFQNTPAKNETRVNSILINDYLRILDQSGWQETHIFQAPLSSERFKANVVSAMQKKKIAAENIGGAKHVVARASEFTLHGVKSKDALHIACAIEGKAEYFLTTDDNLLNKLAKTKELIVINPVNFIPILESM